MRKSPRFHRLRFCSKRKVRFAVEEIEGRRHRCGVRRKLIPGGKAKEDHFYIGILVERPAEDPSLGYVNFLDDLG